MTLPTNLLPVNVNSLTQTTDVLNTVNDVQNTVENVTQVQNRLSTFSAGNIQSVTGSIPNISNISLPLLNFIPPSALEGSLEEIEEKLRRAGEIYVNGLPQAPDISSISSLIPKLPRIIPPIPSVGKIKKSLEVLLDNIKKKKQEAFMRAHMKDVQESKQPYTYRQNIVNRLRNNIPNQ
jgi:hypothetical protein